MKQAFKFVDYNFNPARGIVVFKYSLDNLKFTEKLIFPKPIKKLSKTKQQALDKALFNLFLLAGTSYYKTHCPKKIDLGKYKLSLEQAKFWNKLYTKGLGEFFYVNKINFKNLINFPFDKGYKEKPIKIKTSNKSLVPVGGGKDSIVTIEMLKKKKEKFDLFSLRQFKVIDNVAKVAGKKLLIIDRKFNTAFLKYNQRKGVYRGHIPFSAYLAFLQVVLVILYNYKSIVVSHEKSASYGNVKYLGTTINHQYAKSLEFERDFKNYLHKFITPSIKYYSTLRKMDELDITKEFVKYKKYFPVFSSCNLGNFKIDQPNKELWCGVCAKCVFTWTLLTAYLPEDKVEKIFGKNIYKDKKLEPMFKELLGKRKIKPFECVGTPTEMKQALKLAAKKV